MRNINLLEIPKCEIPQNTRNIKNTTNTKICKGLSTTCVTYNNFLSLYFFNYFPELLLNENNFLKLFRNFLNYIPGNMSLQNPR